MLSIASRANRPYASLRFSAIVLLIASCLAPAFGQTSIFNETFNGTGSTSSTPTNWLAQTVNGGYSRPNNSGVSNNRYAQLTTTTSNQATSLFYTGGFFNAQQPWTLTAYIHMGEANTNTVADAITFAWISASSISATSQLAPDNPGGTNGVGGGALGLYSPNSGFAKQGYAFEIDTWPNQDATFGDPQLANGNSAGNGTTTGYYRYSDLVKVNNTGSASSTWTHMANSLHDFSSSSIGTAFPRTSTALSTLGGGWSQVTLAYNGNSNFTFTYPGNSYSFTTTNYTPSNKCYFGFTSSTGGSTDVHAIDDITLTGSTPEPKQGGILLLGLAGACAVGWARRRHPFTPPAA